MTKPRVNTAALETIMRRSGLNPGQLAALCEPPIDRSYVVNIIAGRRQPSDSVINRLATALRCDVPAILGAPA